MNNLEAEAKAHFEKLEKSLAYHKGRLEQDIPDGVKAVVRREIAAFEFAMQYAREALKARGIEV